jgi:hypothetical protein
MTSAASTHCALILGTHAALVIILGVVDVESVAAQDQPALVRVRSHSARVAGAIADGIARSATFRRLIDRIGATDGLVYVDEGRCGHGHIAACLLVSVTIAGPFRVLHIHVDPRKATGCRLVGAIGHELQHAVEALREPDVRTSIQLYFFFERIGPTSSGRFETGDAIELGLAVEREACRGR